MPGPRCAVGLKQRTCSRKREPDAFSDTAPTTRRRRNGNAKLTRAPRRICPRVGWRALLQESVLFGRGSGNNVCISIRTQPAICDCPSRLFPNKCTSPSCVPSKYVSPSCLFQEGMILRCGCFKKALLSRGCFKKVRVSVVVVSKSVILRRSFLFVFKNVLLRRGCLKKVCFSFQQSVLLRRGCFK